MWDLASWLLRVYLCGCDVSWGCGLLHRSKTKVWFSQTRTLHLLPFSSWPFPYTLGCRKSLVLVFRSVLRDSFSLRGCSFGASLGGGEPRIVLLHQLDPEFVQGATLSTWPNPALLLSEKFPAPTLSFCISNSQISGPAPKRSQESSRKEYLYSVRNSLSDAKPRKASSRVILLACPSLPATFGSDIIFIVWETYEFLLH